ncbi:MULTISPECIES: N-acetyldiaminopimelate deacetylase [unclassified Paenibacillus]|uniref:N-acetyldiaminopimelate deacetylase n=1 Tax=unclassified Paenibacillus TaxID=185978 RepID=UPI00020D79F5|nr:MULTISPECIES: N-acetyldiaminopimelate deacetylase [unclassified Paenibacillus]EGL19755.1 amidohydrolase [Paenibacillus sp. HGF7]EPD92257.1 amidohydrolase [Paenibacillus sp. HGH0039]
MTSPFIELRRQLHRIPEPGFQEFKTQRMLLDYLQTLPQERMEIRTWRTGILVYIKGTNPSKRFGYRADMDGLPIPEETGYPFQSEHPGYMHACGHDVHMSIGAGLVTQFAQRPMKDDLVVVFQPAEEGPGGALPMLASAELSDWMPEQMVGLHIAPEYPVGTIAVRPGILFANTSELFIDLKGKGGHAAYPHLSNDMVVAASQLVGQLHTIVSRNINPLDSAVVTIGKMSAGTKQNIIAENARLEGTIRTLSAESMQLIKTRIEGIVRGIESSFDCTASIDWGSNYLQVYNNEALTLEFMDWLQKTGTAAGAGVSGGSLADKSPTGTVYGSESAEAGQAQAGSPSSWSEPQIPVRLYECTEAMTGEDFGYFLEKIPGFMFWLGAETPYGLHHARIEPDERAIGVAIRTVDSYLRWKSAQSG